MKTPIWAQAPGFRQAWRALELNSFGAPQVEVDRIRNLMRLAQVVAIDAAQADSLPSPVPVFPPGEKLPVGHDEPTRQWLLGAHIPFEVLFIDMHRSHYRTEGGEDGQAEWHEGTLVWTPKKTRVPEYAGGPCFLPFTGGLAPFFMGTAFAGDRYGKLAATSLLHDDFPENLVQDAVRSIRTQLNRAVAVLQFLESVNVDTVTSPLKRQERRYIERKGGRVALVVKVRQNKRRITERAGKTQDYSHRFEVAGHYKHHFEEKPNGEPNKIFERYANRHPDKVLNIQGQRCVRFWTPPYVKGPEDKPLVPKVRVVEPA